MAQSLEQYVSSVRSKYIDVDGAFGAQCWDQWSHYASAFLGVPSWPTYTNAGGVALHSGYACNVYHNARQSGLTKWFDILPASATPRAGDVAFWDYGTAWYPWSHVATVLSVPRAGMIRCLTQNPGAVQIADLVTRGLIGYLRPRALNSTPINVDRTPNKPATPAKKRKKNRMDYASVSYQKKNGNHHVKVFCLANGEEHNYEYDKLEYIRNVAATYQCGPHSTITESHFNAIAKQLAETRARRTNCG